MTTGADPVIPTFRKLGGNFPEITYKSSLYISLANYVTTPGFRGGWEMPFSRLQGV